MSYLVDTNVLSELTRPTPAPSVTAWFEEVADEALHLATPNCPVIAAESY